jgi:hypothetical protein
MEGAMNLEDVVSLIESSASDVLVLAVPAIPENPFDKLNPLTLAPLYALPAGSNTDAK